MTDEYVYVTGQDGEIYEVRPTEALLSFLQRLAEDENEEQAAGRGEQSPAGVRCSAGQCGQAAQLHCWC